MPGRIFGSNWKMYKTVAETTAYLREFKELRRRLPEDLYLFQIPSYTALAAAREILAGSGIHLGAQNVHWEDEGAYTAEISPRMLVELGVEIAEIGHSERREHFGEDDLGVNRKVIAALAHGMTALVCVGETMTDKEYGVSDEVLARQVKMALHRVQPGQLGRIMLAYEPVWAIGERGVPAPPAYAGERQGTIRSVMKQLYGQPGAGVPVLYGGSVNMENARDLLRQPEIDGLFVGRAAWDAARFVELIEFALS